MQASARFAWRPIFVALCIAFAGCRSGDRPTDTIVDDAGRVVAVPSPVNSLVSLAPSITEMVYAAGGGNRMIAVTRSDDYPPQVNALTRLDAVPLNFESIVALQPDLVLMDAEVNRVEDADRLVALGIPAVMYETTSLNGVAEGLEAIGGVLGTTRQADLAAASFRFDVDSLRSLTAYVERPSVLFLIGYNTLYAYGRDSYVHDLIDVAGGTSLTSELQEDPVLNEEFVVASNPDVIIVASTEALSAANLTQAHPGFASLDAVTSNRVAAVDPDVVLRPGPRLVQGAFAIARILHPQLFGDE